MQRRMTLARCIALVVLTVLTFTACGGPQQQTNPSAIDADRASLADLRRADPDANRLLAGGKDEFRRRLADARGMPVVANQWASWCGPCRAEFPLLQRLATRYRGEVAFIGVNTRDSADAARDFLARYPTPYAHIEDPGADVARLFRGGRAWPTTAFYDAAGRLTFTHQGTYATEAQLDDDIRRYAVK